METVDQEKLRRRIDTFVERHGRGAVGLLADQSDYTRQYIRKFRKGHDAGERFLKAVTDALDSLESRNNGSSEARAIRNDQSHAGHGARTVSDMLKEIRTLLAGMEKIMEEPDACTQAKLSLVEAACEKIQEQLIPRLVREIAVDNTGNLVR